MAPVQPPQHAAAAAPVLADPTSIVPTEPSTPSEEGDEAATILAQTRQQQLPQPQPPQQQPQALQPPQPQAQAPAPAPANIPLQQLVQEYFKLKKEGLDVNDCVQWIRQFKAREVKANSVAAYFSRFKRNGYIQFKAETKHYRISRQGLDAPMWHQ